jgi:hypothetical protein
LKAFAFKIRLMHMVSKLLIYCGFQLQNKFENQLYCGLISDKI